MIQAALFLQQCKGEQVIVSSLDFLFESLFNLKLCLF